MEDRECFWESQIGGQTATAGGEVSDLLPKTEEHVPLNLPKTALLIVGIALSSVLLKERGERRRRRHPGR